MCRHTAHSVLICECDNTHILLLYVLLHVFSCYYVCVLVGECDKNHRHCKAYRYRVRRAEQQAVKRAGVSGPNADCDSDDDEQVYAVVCILVYIR
jgi:hypothetical protein